MTMGESRQELLAWVNDLLQLNVSKVEQMGTGSAYVQIFHSIYHDIPLNRIKFNANQEFEYVSNFKVLQKAFLDNNIEKVIPVERLVKCKFQDNLEFLQWVKKYWDTYYPGGDYDAVAFRKSGSSGKSTSSISSAPMRKTGSNSSVNQKPAVSKQIVPRASPAKVAVKKTVDPDVLNDLNKQIAQLQVTVDGLEKERDFYFGKLRDVEILVQSKKENESEDAPISVFANQVLEILYSTEEGFEVPQETQNVDEVY